MSPEGPRVAPTLLLPMSTLWKLLWDYDPNGLLVLDGSLTVKTVNPALCRMLRHSSEELIGHPAAEILGDISDFQRALQEQTELVGLEQAYPKYELYVRKVIFPIPDEGLVAGILVDMTADWIKRNEMSKLKQEAIERVNLVVDKQMNVAQEIAGLLGETTAETRVSLIHLLEMLRKEHV